MKTLSSRILEEVARLHEQRRPAPWRPGQARIDDEIRGELLLPVGVVVVEHLTTDPEASAGESKRVRRAVYTHLQITRLER